MLIKIWLMIIYSSPELSIIEYSLMQDHYAYFLQSPNLLNLSRVSNPPKAGFNWLPA